MKELLKYIEDNNILINDDWFYHAVPFSKDIYTSILKNGISAPYLLPNNNSSYKYIFISKINKDSKCSAFSNYSIHPNFIINGNIHSINAKDGLLKYLFYGGFHGLKFTSMYDDEYQVYKKINSENIMGIIFNLEKLLTLYVDKADYYLNILYNIVSLLNELELEIPIIDYYTEKEINKQKVLSIKK